MLTGGPGRPLGTQNKPGHAAGGSRPGAGRKPTAGHLLHGESTSRPSLSSGSEAQNPIPGEFLFFIFCLITDPFMLFRSFGQIFAKVQVTKAILLQCFICASF